MRTPHLRSALLVSFSLLAAARARPTPAQPLRTPTVTYRRAFVTSTVGPGVLGSWSETTGTGLTGLAAGDKICQVRAEAAGFATAGSPAYRAWLSTSTVDAFCHVQGLGGKRSDPTPCGGATLPGGGPWIRPDGLPFAAALATLVSPADLVTPAAVTETWPAAGSTLLSASFFTGTLETGEIDLGSTSCADWTSGSAFLLVTAGRIDDVLDWSSGSQPTCFGDFPTGSHLLCLEQGTGPQAPFPKAFGYLFFVTSEAGTGKLSTWPDAGGLAGRDAADHVCQSLATAAHLPAPQGFLSWLSALFGMSAIDRLPGGPFSRIDGIQVAESALDLADGTLSAPLSLDETGAAKNEEPYTGTGTDGSWSVDTCNGWLSEDSIAPGLKGASSRTNGDWTEFHGAGFHCDESRPIYCFSTTFLLFADGFEIGDPSHWDGHAP